MMYPAKRQPNKCLHPTAYRLVFQRLRASIGTCSGGSLAGPAAGETRR
jgi:hypothetical protein